MASDGDLAIVAEVSDGLECDFWRVRWNNASEKGRPPFGSCQPPLLKVYAQLSGASAAGISGAEYAVRFGPDDSPDTGYLLFEIPNPSAVAWIGSAFDPPDPAPRGVNISWSECQGGGSSRVLLSTVLVIVTAPCGRSQRPPELSIRGVQHSNPSNSILRCPLFTLCDGPAWTKVCLGDNIVECPSQGPLGINARCSSSGTFQINGTGGIGHCKGLQKPAVTEQLSWTRIKSLYR
jgi:hypothetical protein